MTGGIRVGFRGSSEAIEVAPIFGRGVEATEPLGECQNTRKRPKTLGPERFPQGCR
jgi:hypothetical protein